MADNGISSVFQIDEEGALAASDSSDFFRELLYRQLPSKHRNLVGVAQWATTQTTLRRAPADILVAFQKPSYFLQTAPDGNNREIPLILCRVRAPCH